MCSGVCGGCLASTGVYASQGFVPCPRLCEISSIMHTMPSNRWFTDAERYISQASLTRRGLNKVISFMKTTFWNVHTYSQLVRISLKFVRIPQQGNTYFDNVLAPSRRTVATWSNRDTDIWRHITSVGVDEFKIGDLSPVIQRMLINYGTGFGLYIWSSIFK